MRKNIVLNFRKYYSNLRYFFARIVYACTHKKGARICKHPLTLGVHVMSPQDPTSRIIFPDTYYTIVRGMYAEIERRLTVPDCRLVETGDGDLNRVLQYDEEKLSAAIKSGVVRNIKVRSAFDLPFFEAYTSFLLPQIESLVYGSHVQIALADIARVLACTQEERSSTLWHTDHHFDTEMKVMLYLTDVTEETAPFEYIRHKETKEPVLIPSTYPPQYKNGRVPKEVIDSYIQAGYETHKVTGPAGTLLVFSDKIIHKGNYAKKGYRDTLTLMLDASLFARKLPSARTYSVRDASMDAV